MNPEGAQTHHVIYLNRAMEKLQMPIVTFQRSGSGKQENIILNQAIRNNSFDTTKIISPVIALIKILLR